MYKYKPSKNDAKPTLASVIIIQCANEKEVEINIYIPVFLVWEYKTYIHEYQPKKHLS